MRRVVHGSGCRPAIESRVRGERPRQRPIVIVAAGGVIDPRGVTSLYWLPGLMPHIAGPFVARPRAIEIGVGTIVPASGKELG